MPKINHKPIKILFINEDSESGSFVNSELSAVKDFVFEFTRCLGLEEGMKYLSSGNADAVILGKWESEDLLLDAIGRIHARSPFLPLIVLLEKDDSGFAARLMERGAEDCLPAARADGTALTRVLRSAVTRKQVEKKERERLTVAGEQAEMATKAKTEFLAKMSHEIRNPLNAIMGFSTVLRKSKLGVRQAEQLDTIISCSDLLLGICNDMLDISKIETGQIKLENVDFDLFKLIEDVFKIARTRLQNKSIKFYFEIEADVPTDLHGDSKRLRQILINLLNNAVKFTDKGEISLTVSTEKNIKKKTEHEHLLRFEVADTGIGIGEDKQEMIFELFAQAGQSADYEGGAGLGLAISKAFVEVMGGRIWVESKVGKGSRFIFTAKFAEKEIALTAKDMALVSQAEKITQRNITEKLDCKGVRVLVAEDGIPSQDLIKAYFDYLGCEADYVSDGKQAIEKLQEKTYDICLMDMGMPVMDGVEATKFIRKKISKDLPIIALTAAAMKKDEEACLSAGMDDYIRKPVDVIRLKEKILLHTKSKLVKK